MVKHRQTFVLTVAIWGLLCSLSVKSFQANVPIAAARRHHTAVDVHVVVGAAGTIEKGDETALLPSKPSLPPLIQQIADNRAEFQINLGRAMDTLRRDMPDILSRKPGTYEPWNERIFATFENPYQTTAHSRKHFPCCRL